MNEFDVVELVCQEVSYLCGLSESSAASASRSGKRSSTCPQNEISECG
jgi:hypothetical protein